MRSTTARRCCGHPVASGSPPAQHYETGELFIPFEHRARQVQLKARARGYVSTWLREHPYGPRVRASRVDHEAKA